MPPRRTFARRRNGTSRCAALVVTCVFALGFFAASASAALPDEFFAEIGQAGTGAGDILGPTGIATNPDNGHVYVAESTVFEGTDNARVSEFTPWGQFVKAWGWGVADGAPELQVCTSECRRGIVGSGPGQFNSANGIAVDAAGDIYVFERDNLRVQKFGPAGNFLLMIGGGVDQGPNHPGNLCTAAFIAEGDSCGTGASGTGDGEFSVENVPGINGKYISVGPAGTIYVGDKGRIQEFEPDGQFKASLPLPASPSAAEGAGNPGALAVDPVSGDIYFAFNRLVSSGIPRQPGMYRLSPAGELLDTLDVDLPESIATDGDGNVFVVRGVLGLGGAPEVVEFDSSGNAVVPVGSGFATPDQPANPEESIDLLSVGTNAVGDVYVGALSNDRSVSYIEAFGPPPVALEPPPQVPPTIGDQYATAVTATEATLRSEINPHFWADTTFFVEYGLDDCAGAPCSQQPAPPGTVLGSKVVSTPLVSPDVDLTELEPATTYHYRFVAQSGGGGPVFGTDRTFTTPPLQPAQQACPANQAFRLGAAAKLPDCRAYEMVSPVDKEGADVEVVFTFVGRPAKLDQVDPTGERLTYGAYRAFADPQSAPYSSQYLAKRDPNLGWVSKSISPPRQGPTIARDHGLDTQFKAFTDDLCKGWLFQDTDLSLAPGSVAGFPNLYRADNCGGGYETLTTSEPANVEPGEYFTEIQGVSADGSRALFRAIDVLATGGAKGKTQLYEARDGKLTLVCVRANGAASKESCSAGTPNSEDGRTASVSNAISDDGSVIYWSEAEKTPGRLFVRVNGQETSAVSAGLTAQYWTAAANGSKAIYSEGDELFEFNLATKTSTLIAAGFEGLMGASTDTSRLYLVSSEVLAEGGAAGAPNLYLRTAGQGFEFIATLGAADITGDVTPVSPIPVFHTAQVSPDGGAVAFMSQKRPGLTGFDNTDVESGEADAEVYLYDAEANGGAGRLRCVSCLTSGARPSGRDINGLDHLQVKGSFWAAGQIPVAETLLHAPHVLSDDGARLFFESFDPLAAGDVNGQRDVYEWEEAGSGNCAANAPGFVAGLGGCVNLISSGESPQGSVIVDSSADGSDVFFKTTSRLNPLDPGFVDIYDARVDGGFPAPPEPAAECEDEGCQRPGPTPNDPTPPSSTFVGPENPKPLTCAKGRHKVVKNGRATCVKNRKAKRGKHRNGNRHKQGRGSR
jgi:DNA-binding beta-propeller fold protein YncE